MADPTLQFVIGVSTTVSAATLVVIARRFDRLLTKVEDNEDRSLTNRDLLVGNETRDGVLNRVERVEEVVPDGSE